MFAGEETLHERVYVAFPDYTTKMMKLNVNSAFSIIQENNDIFETKLSLKLI